MIWPDVGGNVALVFPLHFILMTPAKVPHGQEDESIPPCTEGFVRGLVPYTSGETYKALPHPQVFWSLCPRNMLPASWRNVPGPNVSAFPLIPASTGVPCFPDPFPVSPVLRPTPCVYSVHPTACGGPLELQHVQSSLRPSW